MKTKSETKWMGKKYQTYRKQFGWSARSIKKWWLMHCPLRIFADIPLSNAYWLIRLWRRLLLLRLLLLLFVCVFNLISSPFIDSYLSYFSPAFQIFDVAFSSSFIRRLCFFLSSFRIVGSSFVRVERFIWLLLEDDNVNFSSFFFLCFALLCIYFALVKFKNVISIVSSSYFVFCFVSLFLL